MDGSESSDIGRLAVDNILAHHGIMGMHWGHRKPEGVGTGGESSVTVYSKPGKGVIKVSGGEGLLPSQDVKDATSYKQIAKESGTQALTNKELQHLVSRINLDQQYSKLANAPKKQSAGHRFVMGILKNEGKQFMSGKQGPVVQTIGRALGGSGGALSKNPHRSNAYPVGVFKKSYPAASHRP